MSSTPQEVTPVTEVKEPSPEVKAALDFEQAQLNEATQQAQLNYLSSRVQQLVTENLDLKEEIETIKKRKAVK